MTEKKPEKKETVYEKPEVKKEGSLKDITANFPAPAPAP